MGQACVIAVPNEVSLVTNLPGKWSGWLVMYFPGLHPIISGAQKRGSGAYLLPMIRSPIGHHVALFGSLRTGGLNVAVCVVLQIETTNLGRYSDESRK